MNTTSIGAGDGVIQEGFWTRHLAWPLLLAVIVLSVLQFTRFDLWLADRWYAMQGGEWLLRQHWLTAGVLHHDARLVLVVAGLGVLAAALLSLAWLPLRRWRRTLFYLSTSLAVVPLIIGGLKHLSAAPCPWSLQRYGGVLPYHHLFGYGADTAGHCFPAGHASGGYALLALYFAALPHARRPLFWLLPGLLTGLLFGLVQQLRGAHFVSHDAWTLFLSWFIALGLYAAFWPPRGEPLITGNSHP